MLPRTTSIWQRDSQHNASGKPGAVHTENARLEGRLSLRREGRSAVATIRSLQSRADRVSDELKQHEATLKIVTEAQQRAHKVRVQGTKIRDAVDAIRSSIIRREFNERLNRPLRTPRAG